MRVTRHGGGGRGVQAASHPAGERPPNDGGAVPAREGHRASPCWTGTGKLYPETVKAAVGGNAAGGDFSRRPAAPPPLHLTHILTAAHSNRCSYEPVMFYPKGTGSLPNYRQMHVGSTELYNSYVCASSIHSVAIYVHHK